MLTIELERDALREEVKKKDEDIKKLKVALLDVEKDRAECYSLYQYFKKEYYRLLDELLERVNRK